MDSAFDDHDRMESELDAIQQRLRDLKRRLDARQRLAEIEPDVARGDAVEMNPLTAGDPRPDTD